MTNSNRMQVLRIIDANANRAGEGLRVIEDYLRLAINDQHLAGQCKQLRHDLGRTVSGDELISPHVARNTQGDVGRNLQTTSEYSRESAESVLNANLNRVKQALRCLEEYSKTFDTATARQVETVRYRFYEFEQAVLTTNKSRDDLHPTRLYVLIDADLELDEFETQVRQLVDSGVGFIQLRDKELTDREVVDRAEIIHRLTRNHSTRFIINDRPDLTCIANADGVHVGQDDLHPSQARQIVGPNRIVGVSTHSIEQARQAVFDGANYIGVGPIFPSKTKNFSNFPGLALLRQVMSEISLPAFAIGGIDRDNLPLLMQTGCRRVAVGSAVWRARDRATAARELICQLKDAEKHECDSDGRLTCR